MRARTWRWLTIRILGLLTSPSPTRLRAAITPRQEAPRDA